MHYFKQNKIIKSGLVLILLLSFLFLFTQDNSQAATTSPDAIATRVIPNPDHLSSLSWYKTNIKKQGSPQAMQVDGYEAVRDGRTVYVNAANVSGNDFYTNIYLLSFNQNMQPATEDIFSQLLAHWKFNTNVPAQQKEKIRNDTKRLADLADIKLLLANYKATHNGSYPTLSAGSYVAGKSISVWPSWQATLGKNLGVALPLDPVNKFGACAGYDPVTCWDQKNKIFAGVPDNSRVYIYTYNTNGTADICALMESGYLTTLAQGACPSSAVGHSASTRFLLPNINCGSFTSIRATAFLDYLSLSGLDAAKFRLWAPQPVQPDSWDEWKNVRGWQWKSGVNGLVISSGATLPRVEAQKSGQEGIYIFSITAANNVQGSETASTTKQCTINIKIGIGEKQPADCGIKFDNSDWWNGGKFTQTWDGSAWQPDSKASSYSANNTNAECIFKCAAGYHYNSANNTCEINILSGAGACDTKPDYSEWWNGDRFTKIWDSSASAYLPNSKTDLYSSSNTNAECIFKCAAGYHYNSANNTCEINILSGAGACDTKPDYSEWWNGDKFTKIWDSSASAYLPASKADLYSANNTNAECIFKCKSNYIWDGSACKPEEYTAACTAKPNNTVWNTGVTGTATILQTWTGANFEPSNASTYASSGVGCTFSCLNNYSWNGSSCVLNAVSGCETPTGGIKTINGNKTIHTFNSSETFTIPTGMSGNIEVLVVGGGGSNGGGVINTSYGGGGGGGQVVYKGSYPVTAQSYTVTVGGSGQDSRFSTIIAKRGLPGNGNGVYEDSPNNGIGGNSGNGYSGGTGGYCGGGGAGDSQSGTNGNGSYDPYGSGGKGGDGTANSISGILTYYGGGGGGGAHTFDKVGIGGIGGGGNGCYYNANASQGKPNTGGGGGCGMGGSGVVIISYVTEDFSCQTKKSYDLIISSHTANYNLKTAAIQAGWDGSRAATFNVTINSGVYVYSTSSSAPAFDTGANFPSGTIINLINNGFIYGKGGDGGNAGLGNAYNPVPGVAGSDGGTALLAQYQINISNNGIIAGGGGGGGGGGGATAPDGISYCMCGGGGGGGAGYDIGSGGSTCGCQGYVGKPGNVGTLTTGGAAALGTGGGISGSGGNLGQAGTKGIDGTGNLSSVGGAGGAAGKAVVGNNNIVWQAQGDVIGIIIN